MNTRNILIAAGITIGATITMISSSTIANATPASKVVEKVIEKAAKKIFKKSITPGKIGDGTLHGPEYKKLLRQRAREEFNRKYPAPEIKREFKIPPKMPIIRRPY